MQPVDQAFEAFEKFEKDVRNFVTQDISESDTRSKTIDAMLKNVLLWDESSIQREGYEPGAGYYDYKLVVSGFQFVVEAKRNFIEFKIPHNHKSIKLGTFYSSNKEVVDQIRSYLTSSGLQWGVITNGRQYIIGQFINSDGKDWRKNSCLLFNGLLDVRDRFIEFYNAISMTAVLSKKSFYDRDELLSQGAIVRAGVSDPGKEVLRNSLSIEAAPVLDKIFGEIFDASYGDDGDFIKECFVSSFEARTSMDSIEKIFIDQPPELVGVVRANNPDTVSAQIGIELDGMGTLFDAKPPSPIIIIGSKGSGKTTFINYLLKYKLERQIEKNFIPVFIDMRKYTAMDLAAETSTISDDILNKIVQSKPKLTEWKTLLRIYEYEIKIRLKGTWVHLKGDDKELDRRKSEFIEVQMQDVQRHLESVNKYLLKNQQRRLLVVLDNADQLEDPLQRSAYLFAHSLYSKLRAAVIISLREGYYYTWRSRPPFDAYQSNVYHVTAAPFSQVIAKRIKYAISTIKLDGTIKGNTSGFGGGQLELPKQDLVKFFENIQATILSDGNDDVIQFVSHTTYPNIRNGLTLMKQFIRSGHTKVEDYISANYAGDSYKSSIPLHEFIKAVALSERVYYNSNRSFIHNIFRPAEGLRGHFLKFYILYTLRQNSVEGSVGDSFLKVSELFTKLGELSYAPKDVLMELDDLLKFGLIDGQGTATDTDNPLPANDSDLFTITLKGNYYITKLIGMFAYIDLVAIDTPIYLQDSFAEIKRQYAEPNGSGLRALKGRLNFVESFLDYLGKYWASNANPNAVKVDEYILNTGLFEDIERIRKIVNR